MITSLFGADFLVDEGLNSLAFAHLHITAAAHALGPDVARRCQILGSHFAPAPAAPAARLRAEFACVRDERSATYLAPSHPLTSHAVALLRTLRRTEV